VHDAEAWTQFARRDLVAARALRAAGSHLQVGFVCQQAIEKMFKALHVRLHHRLAPKTHDLAVLAVAVLPGGEEIASRLAFLVELTDLCIRARYPDPNWIETLAQLDSAETSGRLLRETEEVFSWLEARLTSV
jgi:HEPN domain-containing protein